jgi:hypothetical protein
MSDGRIHDECDDGRPWGHITEDGVWHSLPKTPLLLADLGPPPFAIKMPSGDMRQVVHNPAEGDTDNARDQQG